MALAVTHSTAADGTFSASGVIAWDAAHSLAGTASVAQGGTGLATIAALSTWVANALDTPIAITPAAGESIRINGAGNAWETYTPAAGGATLNGITAATGAVTIASGNNTGIVWNWANTTNTTVAFTLGETTAATNGTSTSGVPNQVLLKLVTLATSTQSPLSVFTREAHSFSIDPVNGRMLNQAGTAALPAWAFTADASLGFYREGVNELGLASAGSQMGSIYGAGDGQILIGRNSGTMVFTAPSYSSRNAFSTGVGCVTSPLAVGFAVNGVENSRMNAGTFQVSKGTADAVSYAVNFRKSRGTVASPTVITTGDVLMSQSAYAYLGATNTYRETARIEVTSKGTISDATTGVGSIVTIYGKTQGTDAAPVATLKITDGSTATVQLPTYTAATFVAGDKYLVIDASGNIHVSAVGPAS